VWQQSDLFDTKPQIGMSAMQATMMDEVLRIATVAQVRGLDPPQADGPTVFAHACKMSLEGIISKRKGSPYRSGRSPDWLKLKNPACEAVRREAEEDWDDRKSPHGGGA
jgi:ATP-dependent DNA ligase